jgi:hypothetical protein
MPTAQLEVAYRPARVAWLVRGRSRNDLREAIQLASCLWGGMFSLVAAVENAPGTLDEAVRRFRADLLHVITETDGARATVERNRALAQTLVGGGIIGGDDEEEPGLVDLTRALRLRRRDAERARSVCLPVWDEGDRMLLVYAATFGDLSHPAMSPKQREAFARTTGAADVPAEEVAADYDGYDVPIRATMTGLQWRRPRYMIDERPGIFVGNAASLSDLRSYWNVRATGTDVLFWDRGDAAGGPFRRSIEARIDQVAREEEVERPFGWFPCHVATKGDDRRPPSVPTELSELIEAFGLRPMVTPLNGDLGITSWSRDELSSLPSTPAQRVLAHTEERGEFASRVTVELPRHPVVETEGWTRQALGIQMEAYVDSGYSGTLKLPYLPDLNHWYRWETATVSADFRVQDEAFSLITSFVGPTLELTTVRHQALLEKIFDRAGIAVTRSLPGQAAWHLLSQLGGYGGVGALRLPGVRKLLASPSARIGIARGAARGLIHDQGRIEQAERLWLGGEQLDAGRIWEFLLHRRVFLPGIETKCPWCQHASFYRPRDIEDDLQCPRCGRTFPLGPAIERDPVRFRMSSLLEPRGDEPAGGQRRTLFDHQPAAVPVLLTLLCLGDWAGSGDGFVLDTSYSLTGDDIDSCETDIVAIAYGARGETHTHVLVGECKGQGHVTADDVRKLSAVSNRLRASGGVDCDVVFSTTRAAFTDDELALFRDYYERSSEWEPLRRAPLLLTARQLDFNRYSQGGDSPDSREGFGPGFKPLVSWATRRLVPEHMQRPIGRVTPAS